MMRNWLRNLDAHGRISFILLAALSGGAGIFTIVVTHAYDLDACPLCIAQRLTCLIFALVALLALIGPNRLWCIPLALLSLGGLALSLRQSWLQWFPTETLSCSYTNPNTLEQVVAWFGKQWPFLFKASGLCESRDLTFLGLSFANYAALLFLLLFALTLWIARRGTKSPIT